MGWRAGEVWFDTDVLWFREQPALAGTSGAIELPRFDTGLDASRRRRQTAEALRRRRFQTRTAPALALVVGSSAMLSVTALRQRSAGHEALPLPEDPPSLTLRLGPSPFELPVSRRPAPAQDAERAPRIEWRTATADGLPYAGHLHDGTQLPIEGPDWVTWNPVTDSVPNHPGRLFGHERTIRTVISVVGAHRRANPEAPQVVVGDISFRHGGTMDQHVSHQNGLDVDVYYPRLDRRLAAPAATGQVDRRLAQDLLDRFLAAGAKVVFVGYATGLHGPGGVVVPYPNHEDHMHVRFPAP
jgi:hypothetical protein